MSRSAEGAWTQVAAFTGPLADLQADDALRLLERAGIAAARVPAGDHAILHGCALGPLEPIRILVPPGSEHHAGKTLEGGRQ